MEMRCDFKLHGVLEEDVVRVKCNSSLCGHRAGVVVIHTFSTKDGKLISTDRFKDTPVLKKKREEVK